MQAVFFNKKLQWVHNPYMTTILSSGMILPQRYVLDSFVQLWLLKIYHCVGSLIALLA